MTTFGRSDVFDDIFLNINDLTPAKCGQNIPARNGQGHWLIQ
jgi:hypothetical protein